MTSVQVAHRAEPQAKAALLNFFRAQGRFDRHSVVTTELMLDKQSVRADVALCDTDDLHCFEIKTDRDTLVRLDRQLEVYSTHAAFVTVVAATRHINTIISRVPDHVGIYEMFKPALGGEVRIVRDPQRSPTYDPDAMLSLLPVSELRDRLNLAGKAKRSDAIAEAAGLPGARKKEAVLTFLRDRYLSNSQTLFRTTMRRSIKPGDLTLLRRWGTRTADVRSSSHFQGMIKCGWTSCPDQETYNHVGRCFGPVPDEVRAMLTS